MKLKRKNSVISDIREIFKKIKDLNLIYDYIGGAFSIDALWFLDKIYPKLFKIVKRGLNMEQLAEMEKYILTRYSLYGGESIIASFEGKISLGDTQVIGRIYLTNYRIIAHGKAGATTGASMAWAAAMSDSSGSGSGSGIIIAYSISKAIQKNIQKAMRDKFDYIRPCYGYQYPFADAYGKQLTKRAVKYRVDIGIEKKYKTTNKSLKIKIIPKTNLKENLSILKEIISMSNAQVSNSESEHPSNFCGKCGKRLAHNINFCPSCGNGV